MRFKSTDEAYGLIARLLHWGMAIAIFAMFALGYWMRTLNYYSPWYKIAPEIHKAAGIILLVLLLARLAWRLMDHRPSDSYLKPLERKMSHVMHLVFYLLLLVLMLAGYFISTLDGNSISVFNAFDVPSVYQQKGLEKTAGFAHRNMAYGLMALVALHALAALKHHFIDRDITLLRMLRGK